MLLSIVITVILSRTKSSFSIFVSDFLRKFFVVSWVTIIIGICSWEMFLSGICSIVSIEIPSSFKLDVILDKTPEISLTNILK